MRFRLRWVDAFELEGDHPELAKWQGTAYKALLRHLVQHKDYDLVCVSYPKLPPTYGRTLAELYVFRKGDADTPPDPCPVLFVNLALVAW